jgi:uncharacterized repeat protein (TIGR02543 family)
MQLNGSSQYINLGSTLMPSSGTNNFSTSVMFKADKPSEDNDSLIGRYHLTDGGPFVIRNWAHSLVGAWRANTEPTSTSYNTGEINQATGTYNGTTWKLYINGQLAASAASGSASASVSDLLIGALGHQASSVGHHFAGRIYSAQGYSRALSDAEVLANYQALLPGQKVTKSNFTLLPWNTLANGTGTAIGSTVTDLSALPTPVLRLQPSNYNAAAKTWSSTPGSNNFSYRGTPELITSNSGKFGATGNFPAIGGTSSAGINLGNAKLPTYTLCVVARYRGLAASPGVAASQGRLINGTSENWISGYHAANISEFHHTNDYNYNSTITDLNWHYHCDSGNRAWWDGAKVSPWTNQATTYLPPISINNPNIAGDSDWELADLIIYDQFLPDSQIEQINRYFRNTYGILAGPTSTAAAVNVSPSTTYSSTGDTTLYANWGSAITYDGNKQTSGSTPSPTLITGASGALATNSGTLARAGFRFDGWNTNESGTGTTYAAGGTYPNTGNVTLYAKWTLKTLFPTSTSVIEPNNLLPYMRYKASDYDATAKTWRDSSGNARNVSLINGSPSVVTTTANSHGSSKAIQVLQGITTDQITFDNPTTTGGRYTLFSLVRYGSALRANQERILNSLDGTWFTGHHGGKAGVSYHEGTWIQRVSQISPLTNWVLGSDYTSAYRANGVQQTLEANGGANLRRLTINAAGEASDFQVAEIILYDRALTLAEIKQVEEYLAFTYGITAYSLTGTYATSSSLAIGAGVGGRSDTLTAINGLGTKTITMSPLRSGITLETTTANSGVIVVSPVTATGVYAQTITATDATGEAVTHVVTVTVNPSVRFDTSTATTLIGTHRRAASLRLNTVLGVGTKVFTMTSAGTGITLDTSTAAASGFATLRVDTFTAVGTYTQLITVTDDTKIKSTYTVTITINGPPTISSTSAIATTPVTSGLRLSLDAGDPESYGGSGTTWTDLSGNGKNATWQVSPTFVKDFGGAFTHARATNQYALTSNLGTTDVLSVETWIKFNSLNTGNVSPCVISDAYLNTKINYSICFHSNNELKGGYHTGSWTRTSGFTPVVGTWYHLVYTISKSGSNYISTLYQNGNVVGTPTNATMIPGNSEGNTYLGRRWDLAEYVNGQIPIFRVYNRALSAIEVAQNYNALLPRFSNNPTNSVTITTTESVTASSSIYYAGLGTGNKTFSLSNPTAGISIDTSTVNTVRLNTATTLTATSTTSARTIAQVITATDTNGVAAATPVYVTTVVNPKIIVTDPTPGTLSTTFGRFAYDTFTATQGTETKTFTVSSASFGSAFTMTNPSANTGVLTVANNLPADTYTVTITATDTVGATTNLVLTVVVNPVPTIAGATGNTLSTTLGRDASLRINVVGGTGTRTITWTSPQAGITLNTSTLAAQNFITLTASSAVPVRSYSFSIAATDSSSVRVADTFTVVVNRWPVIGSDSVVQNGLAVNLDASTYSGTGNWLDSSGFGRNAVDATASTVPAGTAPEYSNESGGIFSFNEGTATTNHMLIPNPGTLETFTVSTWVRFKSIPTNNTAIITQYWPGGSNTINYVLAFSNSSIYGAYYRGNSGWTTASSLFTPQTNTWYHLSYSIFKSGSNYFHDLYVNGVKQGSSVDAGTIAPSSNGSVISLARRWDFNATAVLNGAYGNVSIYNRALSASEILQNYNATGSRYFSANSGRETVTVTQGVAGSISNVGATQGTGTKTIAITNASAAVTIDTSITNSFTLNLANTLTSTSTTVARTLTETVTATDAAGATTARVYSIVVNPPVRVESTTGTITTTSGIVAWDTFTATLGTGSYTFGLAGTPNTNGFTLTQTSNRAVLRVGSTVNPGTYNLTITATDAVGAVTAVAKTVVVNNLPTISGNPNVSGTRGYTFNSPTYGASGGTGNLTFSIATSPAIPGGIVSGIKLSNTTGTPSIIVESTTASDTYTVTLRVTDSLTASSTFIVTVKVNTPVTLTGSLSLSKVYGEELSQVYTTGGGTPAFNIFASTICTSEKSTYVGNGTNGTSGVTYSVERFNGVGTCNWAAPTSVTSASVLVLGGGGAGGGGIGGGGGAGEFYEVSSLTLTPNSPVSITVGAGGAANSFTTGSLGDNSAFGLITAYGGGGGGTNEVNGPSASRGANGELYGSGGGGGYPNILWDGATRLYGIQGNANRGVVPFGTAARGNGAFGSGGGGSAATGGGGGGAGTAGVAGASVTQQGGSGGAGLSSSITGTATVYAGGGGGGVNGAGGANQDPYRSAGREGAGGSGGGGAGGVGGGCTFANNVCNPGSVTAPGNGSPGLANTGGGGGGGSNTQFGGRGGSGTVIVRYVTPAVDTETTRITLDTLSTGPVGALRLNAPRNLPVNSYSQTITVIDSAATPASTTATVTLTVTKATPTVTLSLPGSVTTAKYGNPVTISAIATTAGNVAFIHGNDTITACAAVATTAGLATCSWTPIVVGATTLKAILSPTDSTNYNKSTLFSLPITVTKADTLTVTVLSQSETFTGSTISATRAFITSGLAPIDSLTAISMLFAGTANDGNSYSNTTAPTNAGTYSITPNFPTNAAAFTFGVGSAGTTSAITNYESVTVVSGTLTVNRKPQTMVFTYPNSNTVTYSPTATLASTATTRLGEGTRTYSTTTPVTCSVSETAAVTVLQAGSCSVQMAVALTPNFEADTATRVITINKASRTFVLTPGVSTLKFADTTTVTATLSAGAADGTISYILGSPAGCTFDPLSGELLAISGTVQCPLRATISEGINYLAETSTAISLTIARANAPVITIDTVTALSHTPGIRALITPTFTVSGLKNTDTANSVIFTYGLVSNPFETFAYSDTRTPIDAGTYSITPSALTLSSGLMSNYETPTYSASAINVVINRISQETVTIQSVNGEVDVPFNLIATGGSTSQALSFTRVSGDFCSVSGTTLTATQAGSCVVTVTRPGDRNYLPYTSASVTVRVRNFVVVVVVAPSNPVTGITIAPSTPPLTKAPNSNACLTGCVPSITSIDVLSAAEGELVIITGLSFNGVNKVYFRLDTFSPTDDVVAPNYAVDSDTQISVRVPTDLVAGEFYTIRVATPEKTSARFYDIEILP